MNRPKPTLSRETLCVLLRYEPETGKLYWRARTPDMFPSSAQRSAGHNCRAWNAKHAGKEALTSFVVGYPSGGINGTTYLAHRVIWCMVTGQWPHEVDHKNGVRSDNRWTNLREVSRQENSRNHRLKDSNTSGTVGVLWYRQRWRSYICINGKQKHLGCFVDLADAIAARKAAEHKYGFHPNHGRSA